MNNMQHLEIRTIRTNDINVTIKIDYDAGTVSLVENQGTPFESSWKPKRYLFAGRELNFMNGWLNILGAMRAAVEEGKKALEKDLTEKSAFKEEAMIEFFNPTLPPLGKPLPKKPIKRSKQNALKRIKKAK